MISTLFLAVGESRYKGQESKMRQAIGVYLRNSIRKAKDLEAIGDIVNVADVETQGR